MNPKKIMWLLFQFVACIIILGGAQSIARGITINIGGGSVGDVSIDGGMVRSGGSGCGGGVEGNGIAKKENRKVDVFSSVEVDGAFNVYIECRKKQNLELSGDSNILPHIITRVKGNTLQITTSKTICPKTLLEVRISADNIEKAIVSGAVDLSISGVDNNNLDIDVDGAGDIKAAGKTKNFKINLSGSGDVKAKELKAENVEVLVNGAGNAVVYASRKLKAEINGAGDISYYGNPKDVTEDISGAGDIIKK
ncbi:MAG: head GIN domain-containing protein [Desulfobacterales bacterium]